MIPRKTARAIAANLLESVTWRVPDYTALLWEQFDETYHLFNPRSGQTHIINEPAHAALKALSESPTDLHGLMTRLGLDPESDEMSEHFRRLMWELDQLGLIVPVVPS